MEDEIEVTPSLFLIPLKDDRIMVQARTNSYYQVSISNQDFAELIKQAKEGKFDKP